MQIDSSHWLANTIKNLTLSMVDPIGIMATGREYVLDFVAANNGSSRIIWSDEAPLTLSSRWFLPGDTINHISEGPRAFPKYLEPQESQTLQLRVCAPDIHGPALLRVSAVCESICWFYDESDTGWLDLPIQVLSPTLWPDDVRGGKQSIALRGYVSAFELQRRSQRAAPEIPASPPEQPESSPPEAGDTEEYVRLVSETLAAVNFPPLNTAILPSMVSETKQEPVPEQLPDLSADPIPKLRWFRHPIQSLRDFLLWVFNSSSIARDVAAIRQQGKAHAAEIQALNARIASLRDAMAEILAEQERRRALAYERALNLFQLSLEAKSRKDHALLRELNHHVLEAVASTTSGLSQVSDTLAASVRMLENLKDAVRRANMPVLQTIGLMEEENAKRHGLLMAGLDKHALAHQLAWGDAKSWQADASKSLLAHSKQLQILGQRLEEKQNDLLQELLLAGVQGTEAITVELGQGLGAVRTNLVQLHGVSENLCKAIEEHRATTLEVAAQVTAHRGESSTFADAIEADLAELKTSLLENAAKLGSLLDKGAELRVQADQLEALVHHQSQAVLETVQQRIGALSSEFNSGLGLLSGKSDVLIHRQIISAPKSGMIIARNMLGLFAIPDSDIETLSYYSSGVAPEPGSLSVLRRLLEPGSCFVDVGANIGLFTVAAGRIIGGGGRIISVEPAPNTMAALDATVRLNGLAALVERHAIAAGREQGEAELNVGKVCGYSSLYPLEDPAESVVVPVAPLDEIIGKQTVDLIKIDVEGFELDVIEGLQKTLSANFNASILVEFSPLHLARSKRTIADWDAMLSAHGFAAYAIDEDSGALREVRITDLADVVSVNLLLARGKHLELIRT